MDINIIGESSKKRKNKYAEVTNDKRLDIINALQTGSVTRTTAASTFQVSYDTVCRIYRKFCTEEKSEKEKRGGFKKCKLKAEHSIFLKTLLENDCTLSANAMKKLLFDEFALIVSITTIQRSLSNFGFSFKRVTKLSSVSLTNEMKEKRISYSKGFLQMRNSNQVIIFYDETGFQISMRNFYGRSMVGKKAVVSVPCLKSRNITVMAAMGMNGLLFYKVINVPCNRSFLIEYLELLFEALKTKNISNGIIIMDNASFHKGAQVKEVVEKEGHHLVFLPAYSPFFNPIENMFSQWKKIVRNAAPKSEVELMTAINDFKNILTEEECANYYQHITNNCIECMAGRDVYDI